MTIHRFFVDARLKNDGSGALGPQHARQISRVLRMKPGDEIVVFNGTGIEGRASLIRLSNKSAEYVVHELYSPSREPPVKLVVGVSLLKGSKFDVVVQKLTELGVSEIAPIGADRSVAEYRNVDSWTKRSGRLQRIIVESAEQSERVTLPKLHVPESLDNFLDRRAAIVLVERRAAAEPLSSLPVQENMAIAIGPEGGWSDRELELISNQADAVATLGSLILRAETAAILAAGVIIQKRIRGRSSA